MLTLKRLEEKHGVTLGQIFYNDSFVCHTFELPWKDNEREVSCIPPGTYRIKLVYSSRLKRNVFTLMDVPGRTAIHIHPANRASEIKGCIAPFLNAETHNGFFGRHSGEATRALESVINKHEIKEITVVGILQESDIN
jgi:hypothetical protein